MPPCYPAAGDDEDLAERSRPSPDILSVRHPRAAKSRIELILSELDLAKCDKPRVLVADCEPVIADTLSILLNLRGYEARSVSTYPRAMEVLESFQPHLLISCLKLGGVKFPMDVSDRFPDCKIIVISGLLDAFLEALGYVPKKGSRLVWWRKPVHPQDIFQKAEELLFPGKAYAA